MKLIYICIKQLKNSPYICDKNIYLSQKLHLFYFLDTLKGDVELNPGPFPALPWKKDEDVENLQKIIDDQEDEIEDLRDLVEKQRDAIEELRDKIEEVALKADTIRKGF